jgi:hypothetical protein
MKKWLAGAGAVVFLAACSHSTSDYRDAAKKAISGKDAEAQLGQKFQDIQCETPSAKDVGTTFTCTATGTNDGKTWTFTANIESKNKVLITDAQPSG